MVELTFFAGCKCYNIYGDTHWNEFYFWPSIYGFLRCFFLSRQDERSGLYPDTKLNSTDFVNYLFYKQYRSANTALLPSLCDGERYKRQAPLDVVVAKRVDRPRYVLRFCVATPSFGNFARKILRELTWQQKACRIARSFYPLFLSRHPSINRRNSSGTVTPSSFASSWSHFIWGAVNTIDVLCVFMRTLITPERVLVKGLA